MKHRAVASICLFVLALGAQQPSDKPSPVPRRPLRPRFVSTLPDRSRPLESRRSEDVNTAVRENGAERSNAAGAVPGETGTACFFSSSANGGLTASGSRLNSEDLVAAHPRFPLGSLVRAKNLANGKTVDVRIVDRFPESFRRVINLSEAAAGRLGFVKAGTALVELELIEEGPSAARESGHR